MQAQTQIPKPANWQDFETLCKKLWGEIWECADTITKNGRAGQNQHGIDIWGMKMGEDLYSAIQCKGKDDYTHSKLTTKEIDDEIEKAKYHKEQLKRFVIATTANKDAEIEEYVRNKNLEHKRLGLFDVCLFSWEDVVDKLIDYEQVYKWYMTNSHYATGHSLTVSFEGEKKEYIIHPTYKKQITKFVLPNDKVYLDYKKIEQHQKKLTSKGIPNNISRSEEHDVNYQMWCKVPICIQNSGTATVELAKIKIDCTDKVLAVNNHMPTPISDMMGSWDNQDEVITCWNYPFGLLYQPQNSRIVSKDYRYFEFYVKPKHDITNIELTFEIIAEEYHSKQTLTLISEPEFHRHYSFVVVNSEKEKKEDEIEIIPNVEY